MFNINPYKGLKQATEFIGKNTCNAALAAILLLASILNLTAVQHYGYCNEYYAAAVKSMLLSPHNFFFVSSDFKAYILITYSNSR